MQLINVLAIIQRLQVVSEMTVSNVKKNLYFDIFSLFFFKVKLRFTLYIANPTKLYKTKNFQFFQGCFLL